MVAAQQDMKEGDALLVETFIRLKREGFEPDRDLILALTADEEGGSANGIDWLLKEHKNWIDAEYCINLDGGEFEKLKGKRVLAGLQASEKVYADFEFETFNPGGHSSVPGSENAIYELSAALLKVQNFSFPVKINDITRNYFAHSAELTTGKLAEDLGEAAKQPADPGAIRRLSAIPYYNSLLHTTCVATMLSGGHATNALPQTAKANVNCRIFPGEAPEDVLKTLEKVVANPGVKISMVQAKTSDGKPVPILGVPASPLLPELVKTLEKTAIQCGRVYRSWRRCQPGRRMEIICGLPGCPRMGFHACFLIWKMSEHMVKTNGWVRRISTMASSLPIGL